MILGTISGMLFASDMCMVLLPERNAFKPGVCFGVVGLVLGLITVFVWRRTAHKDPIHISGRNVLACLVGIVGALGLGIGMCFCMIRSKTVFGALIGIAGIAVLLCLIPLTKGIKD